ncbi:MAG: hypothetical protein ACQESD_06590 [Thermoplasmatota archaeon]
MHKLTNGDDFTILMVGIVKGLVSEGDRIGKIVEEIDFDIGALPISREELKALEEYTKEDDSEEYQLTTPEIAYARNLEKFGQVEIPPPSYISLLRYCQGNDKEIKGLDMDDEHYTMAYCEHVSGTNWLMQSFREKRLVKKKVDAKDPRKFALKWDRIINRLAGYKELEEHREEVIAKNLRRFSKKGVLFAVIEFERLEGVIENFDLDVWSHEEI